MEENPGRKNMTTIIQLVILVVLCGGVAGLMAAFGVFTPGKGARSVTFRVENSAGDVQLIYSMPGDKSQDPMRVSTPWEKSASIAVGSEVYLLAANPAVSGKLKCTISFDGKIWKTQTVSSPDNKVTCAGIIP